MIEVDVFADIVCPWCYIGTQSLEKALAGQEATVRFHPYFLDPSTPEEGKDVAQELARKYNADPKMMFARVEAAAKQAGVELDLSRQPMTYPTLKAHTLLRLAEENGKHREVSRALYEAHFRDGKNIADVETLVAVADVHGLANARAVLTDPAALAATKTAATEGMRMGIRGVPFFVLNRQTALSGAQPKEVFIEALGL